ncbi:unnamed protein product [Anisakis simplex]|uniref:Uncharacterized protein n=1 Tax=Anisakis simplex TaxID=6269 RepID=A0A3P6RWZ6_ANISI|nr:unnamed protein product [Anisakis simplex]
MASASEAPPQRINSSSNTATANDNTSTTYSAKKLIMSSVQTEKQVQAQSNSEEKPISLVGSLRSRANTAKPVVTLHNTVKPIGLSLNDNDSLKTPTVLGTTDVTLRTPTILGSPTKGPLSAVGHSDELTTPRLSLSAYSTPNTQAQAFFGEHEPLLTGTTLSNNCSSSSGTALNTHTENKDSKTTITIKGNISTSISTFGTQNVNSPGLSATMFQFSPLVEHFLQSITKTQQTNSNLPLLVLDSNAKTPSATDTPDLFKVLQDKKDVTPIPHHHHTQPSTSQPSMSSQQQSPQLATDYLQLNRTTNDSTTRSNNPTAPGPSGVLAQNGFTTATATASATSCQVQGGLQYAPQNTNAAPRPGTSTNPLNLSNNPTQVHKFQIQHPPGSHQHHHHPQAHVRSASGSAAASSTSSGNTAVLQLRHTCSVSATTSGTNNNLHQQHNNDNNNTNNNYNNYTSSSNPSTTQSQSVVSTVAQQQQQQVRSCPHVAIASSSDTTTTRQTQPSNTNTQQQHTTAFLSRAFYPVFRGDFQPKIEPIDDYYQSALSFAQPTSMFQPGPMSSPDISGFTPDKNPSSVASVCEHFHEVTISPPTFVHIPVKSHLVVKFVGANSLDPMNVNDIPKFILNRRSPRRSTSSTNNNVDMNTASSRSMPSQQQQFTKIVN